MPRAVSRQEKIRRDHRGGPDGITFLNTFIAGQTTGLKDYSRCLAGDVEIRLRARGIARRSEEPGCSALGDTGGHQVYPRLNRRPTGEICKARSAASADELATVIKTGTNPNQSIATPAPASSMVGTATSVSFTPM